MSLAKVNEQPKISHILLKSIENNKVSHAYIFTGANGVGKGKVAMEFTKALNCTSGGNDACDHCQNCKRIEHHNHQDVIWIKPDGNSIKIEQVRQLQRDSNYKSVGSRYKVFIIEQAEKLTVQASNSLLKFLEEPTSPTVAILITENHNQLIPTIKSRCQTLTFSHLSTETMVNVLSDEGYKSDDIILASHLTEDIQEVRNLLNSEQFAQMRNLVIQWSEDILFKKNNALFMIDGKVLKNDYIKEQLPQFLDLLLIWYRDILNVRLNRRYSIIYREYENILNKQALLYTEEELISKMEIIMKTKQKIDAYVNPQLALEYMVLTLWEG